MDGLYHVRAGQWTAVSRTGAGHKNSQPFEFFYRRSILTGPAYYPRTRCTRIASAQLFHPRRLVGWGPKTLDPPRVVLRARIWRQLPLGNPCVCSEADITSLRAFLGEGIPPSWQGSLAGNVSEGGGRGPFFRDRTLTTHDLIRRGCGRWGTLRRKTARPGNPLPGSSSERRC